MACLLLPLLAQAAPAAGGGGPGLYSRLSAWGWAEPVSIDAYGSDWRRGLDRQGDDASAIVWAETGVSWRQWRFGAVTDQVVLADANRQTAALYHRVRNDQPFRPGERFKADLDVLFVRLQGLRVGYAFSPRANWNLELGLSLFDGFDLVDGTLRGEAVAVGEEDYEYNARLRYFYDEDVFFDRPVRAEDGVGAALDLALTGRWGERAALDLRVHNLIGRVWWNDAPYTTGLIDSNTRQQDENGNLSFNPTLRGFEGNRDFRQDLPAFAVAAMTWEWDKPVIPGMRVRANPLHVLPALTAAVPIAGAGRVELETMLRPYALGLAWTGRYGEIRLSSDRSHYKDAHVLVIGLGFALSF